MKEIIKELMNKFSLLLLIYLFISANSFSQLIDSGNYSINAEFSYISKIPKFDLKERVNYINGISTKLKFISPKLYFIGLKYDFIFYENPKDLNMLNELVADEYGNIIGNDGELFAVNPRLQGGSIVASFGKIFDVQMKNFYPFVELGFGYMWHKIFFNNGTKSTQLTYPQAQFYDRYTSGYQISESIGIKYFSNNRLLNFAFSLDYDQAFTHLKRKYQVDYLISKSNILRKDFSLGFRLSWILQLYSTR